MVSLYDLKPRFQNLLRPLTRVLARWGVTANQVTVAAMCLSIGTGISLAWFRVDAACWLALPLVLFLRMALNAIDGMLAREHGMKTPLGAFLNELGDIVSDAALYLPFAVLPMVHPALVFVTVLLAGLTETAGIIGQAVGNQRRYEGPLGKSDRAVVFGAVGLALGLGVSAGGWLNVVFGVAVVLLIVTVCNRVHKTLQGMHG